MKIFCFLALCVAVAAAQSDDRETPRPEHSVPPCHTSVTGPPVTGGHGDGGHTMTPWDDVLLFSIFKIDNVAFQNSSAVTFKEREYLFIEVRRGPHSPPFKVAAGKRQKHGMIIGKKYVKLSYNSSQPKNVSVEYGVVKSGIVD